MFKVTFILLLFAAAVFIPLRLAITYSGFFRDGIIEGMQSCKEDSDCTWAPTGCCGCETGGREMLINKQKDLVYKLLVKDICLGEKICVGENACNSGEVYCDQTCKFGKRTYTKPLLLK